MSITCTPRPHQLTEIMKINLLHLIQIQTFNENKMRCWTDFWSKTLGLNYTAKGAQRSRAYRLGFLRTDVVQLDRKKRSIFIFNFFFCCKDKQLTLFFYLKRFISVPGLPFPERSQREQAKIGEGRWTSRSTNHRSKSGLARGEESARCPPACIQHI